ncbi:MAG TPA: ATP-binding cassette domain-containing protein, partial [Kiloniellaceae bacterium]|nr:ATP-binding cassette domain-containing protein [Kiloniellaceae bacterium]
KSTLLKLMLGLLQPNAGEIRIDGQPLSQYGIRHWRQQLGVVMQDDQLLSGSIAENIAFFDPELDLERVRQCAEAARIAADIQRMPMQYQSLIGEMGAALSGGQRQRLLLARALYRRPRVLFLDEGTANLDIASEREIADVIAAMDITRIIVAHRPELIRRADRVYEMRDGRLHPVR